MAFYLLRRVLVSVPTLVGITLVTFLVSPLLPADLVLVNRGDGATRNPELVRASRARWSLDRPLPFQYLVSLRNLARGNLGASIATTRPVLTDLALPLPMTIELATLSTLIALVVGVGFGVVAAVRRDTLVDTAARAVSLVGVAVPTFWFAILLVTLVYFRLGWAPPPGRLTAGIVPPVPITGMYLVDSALRGQWTVWRDTLAH